jgi:hypothetical protein
MVLATAVSADASGARKLPIKYKLRAVAAKAKKSAAQAPILFGAYSPPSPEAGMAAAHALEQALGRRLDIVLWYQHWGGWGPAFDPAWVDLAVDGSDRIPLLTWEPWGGPPGPVEQPQYRLRRIADGEFDLYIRSWAEKLAAYGRVVYLRPMHEMNSNWYPWAGLVNGNTPEDYVAAWRRMHDLFVRAGAKNVRWVWSPCADDVPFSNVFERYYPGDEYVDVLGLDGYNWGASAPEYGGWRPFERIFGLAYARIAKLGPQPIWIAETASAPDGGDKAAWVRAMFQWAAQLPRLKAIVWFNTLKERDWRATSPDGVAQAFAPR